MNKNPFTTAYYKNPKIDKRSLEREKKRIELEKNPGCLGYIFFILICIEIARKFL